MRKKLKKTYKLLRSYYFSALYKKIHLKSEFQPKFIKLKKPKLNKISYKVYSIKNCRIYTNCVENVSVIKNNQLIAEGSFQQINGKLVSAKRNEVLKSGTPKFLKKINGNVFNLTQGASGYNNYSHWLLDIVPKIIILSKAYDLKKVDYFYFSKLNHFQKETLKILKLSSIKIIDSKFNKHCLVENLMFCTHPHYFKGTLFNAHSNIPKWIIYNLRKIFLSAANKKIGNCKKIYIDRSDSQYNHCKIINDTEIKKYLKKKGFRIIRLSEYSLKEQISIFKNCNFVVAPHGAGLANLTFCKKKTKVLEIKNIGHPNIGYQKISKYNKLKHQFIMLKKIENNKQGDLFLPIKKLEKFLN